MKGRIGIPTSYRTRLPNQWHLERMTFLSKGAKKRLKWIDYYRKHKNKRKTCRYFGISPTTFYKWLIRYEKMGLKGLEEKSRRPKTFRKSKIPLETIFLITSLRKKHPSWSKYKLEVILRRDYGIKLSSSSIGRILKKKDLIDEKKARRKRKAAERRKKREKAEKHLKEAFPGSLVYIDTKHLTFPGKKFYQFTAIDSKTRIKFICIYSGASSKAGKLFLKELFDFMPFPIINIQTDNGSEFLKHFDEELKRRNIHHYFSDPNCPKQNSRVERAIQTSEYEFWNYNEAYTVKELNELADEWTYTYNYIRPHQALGYLTPMEYYESLKKEGKIEAQVSTM
jgi:transposase InsO family protein